jgi:hypothetical protein
MPKTRVWCYQFANRLKLHVVDCNLVTRNYGMKKWVKNEKKGVVPVFNPFPAPAIHSIASSVWGIGR